MSEPATVLVVDDDEDLLGLYERHLSGEYDVRTATSGEAALEAVDEEVRVLVLDRRMPDIPGAEVLARVEESDADPRVVMVTAVEPDFDIIEMAFDDYLVKPVSKERLRETVEHMLTRATYSALLDEYYRTANKIATLEASKSPEELSRSDEFTRLQERAQQLQEEVSGALQEMDEYSHAFHEIDRLPELSRPPRDPDGE